MKKLFVVCSLLVLSVPAFAQKQFEYQAVDYVSQTDFMPKLTALGADGWELSSCVTSGSSSYTANESTGGFINGLLVARTSYCILKREK